jgi:hypothetical protein
MTAQAKAREKADVERLRARVQCWWIRSKRLVNGIEEVGISLRSGLITVVGAHQMLADLAIEADELAAGLAEGEEILPDRPGS